MEKNIRKNDYRVDRIDSPIGLLSAVSDEKYLLWLEFGEIDKGQFSKYKDRYLGHLNENIISDIPGRVEEDLKAYFEEKLREFSIPLRLFGTDFQKSVWNALQTIPYGETISYGELAKKIEKPGAMRAVGNANGKNPIPIIIPCHRVIQADGSIGGFFGGLDIKRKLLELEN